MTTSKEGEGGRFSSSPARVGMIAVLLVLAVVVARARAQHVSPHVNSFGAEIVIEIIRVIGVAILVGGVVALLMGRRALRQASAAGKKPKRKMAAEKRKRNIRAALIGMVAAFIYEVVSKLIAPPPRSDQQQPPPQQNHAPPPNGRNFFEHAQQQGPNQPGIGAYVTAILAAVVLVVLVIVVLRRTRVLEIEEEEEDEDETETVARAVAAGREAMQDRRITDPREAIVACFAAMERALSGLGGDIRPRDADTPEEVLRRGIEGASLPGEPSRTLLLLFHEARFSVHPLDDADRDSADDALGAILGALGRDVEARR